MKTWILDTNGKEIKTGDRVRAMWHDYTVYYSPITNTFMLDDNNYLSNYESVEII